MEILLYVCCVHEFKTALYACQWIPTTQILSKYFQICWFNQRRVILSAAQHDHSCNQFPLHQFILPTDLHWEQRLIKYCPVLDKLLQNTLLTCVDHELIEYQTPHHLLLKNNIENHPHHSFQYQLQLSLSIKLHKMQLEYAYKNGDFLEQMKQILFLRHHQLFYTTCQKCQFNLSQRFHKIDSKVMHGLR